MVWKERWAGVFVWVAGLLVCRLAARYLVGWLWPLLAAWALSAVIRRPVAYLSGRRILKKQTAAILLTLVCLALAGALVWLAVSLGIGLLQKAAELLPGVLERLQLGVEAGLTRLEVLRHRLPAPLRGAPLFTAEGLTQWLAPAVPGLGRVLQKLTGLAVDLPEMAFCLVFLLTAAYYMTVDRELIRDFVHHQLSPRQSMAFVRLREYMAKSVAGWLRAQLVLISASFCLLLAGFWLLGLRSPLLTAAAVGCVDALPVLGAGAVLLPWGLWTLVTGNGARGTGLLILYGLHLTVHNLLEPRLVSSSLGLHPFVTLVCLFFGFRLGGLAGMFLLPLAVLALKKLQEWEYIRLWR
jgi:sporulation integral membrane protein YtvI